jgi:hypothetical protein
MRIVEIQLPANDVSIPAENMRRWLDDVQFDPSTPAWDEIVARPSCGSNSNSPGTPSPSPKAEVTVHES